MIGYPGRMATPPAGMGGLLSDFAGPAFGINDPRDREALDLVEEIVRNEMSSGGPPGGIGGDGGGFRLGSLVPYLKIYRFHQEYPWAIPLGLGVVFAGLLYGVFYLGERTGRGQHG